MIFCIPCPVFPLFEAQMDELENFSDLDNLLSLADDEDFILNSSATSYTENERKEISKVEENDCELVSVKIATKPLTPSIRSSISSFFSNTFKLQTKKGPPKSQTSISAFFKPPKRLPEEEPAEQVEVKKMPKVVPFVFPSLKHSPKTPSATTPIDELHGNGKQYKLPKFKLIPGTPFAVDAFSYGPIDRVTGFFLTHFHSDHYKGLSNKLFVDRSGIRLYCSDVTGNLVKKELRIKAEFITTLKIGQIYIIEGIHVGVFDANQ